MQAQDGALAALDLLDVVGVDHEGERRAVGAGGGLDHVGDVALLRLLVEVLQLLARELRVLAQVEVAAVGDPLELRPADREQVLDVRRRRGVVRELLLRVLAQAQVVGADAEAGVPALALREPVLEPRAGLVRRDEVLHLHLLELARAKDEVAGGDLVAKGLADLGDPERRPAARELQHVLEVDEDPLGGLGAQVDGRGVVAHRPHVGLEHEVELARVGEVALVGLAGPLRRLLAARGVLEVVGAEAQLAGAAVDERVGEALEVARRLPRARVLEDRRVERHDVVALADHRPPPLGLDVALEQDAVVAVVVGRAQPAVDLRRLEDEPAALAQRDDLVERDVVGGLRALLRASGLHAPEPSCSCRRGPLRYCRGAHIRLSLPERA